MARNEACDAAVAHANARARIEAQAAALTDRPAAAEQAQGRQTLELERVNTELASAQRRAERAETRWRSRVSYWQNCALRCTSGLTGGDAGARAVVRPRRRRGSAARRQSGSTQILDPEDGHDSRDSTDRGYLSFLVD